MTEKRDLSAHSIFKYDEIILLQTTYRHLRFLADYLNRDQNQVSFESHGRFFLLDCFPILVEQRRIRTRKSEERSERHKTNHLAVHS